MAFPLLGHNDSFYEIQMKDSKLKIVTIGSASSYTPELIEGSIDRKDKLHAGDIGLGDILNGKEKLVIVGTLAKRMIEKSGLNINCIIGKDGATPLTLGHMPLQIRGIVQSRPMNRSP